MFLTLSFPLRGVEGHLTSDALLAENIHTLIKGCQALPARSPSVVYIIPFVSPCLVLCSLCCLSYSPSPPLFSVTPLPVLLLSDGSLRSVTSKDVFVPLFLPSKIRPASVSSEADQTDGDLERPRQVISPDASAYSKSDRVHTPVKHGSFSEESSTFN